MLNRFSRDGRLIGIRCVVKVEPLEPDLSRENFISDPSFPNYATKSIAFPYYGVTPTSARPL